MADSTFPPCSPLIEAPGAGAVGEDEQHRAGHREVLHELNLLPHGLGAFQPLEGMVVAEKEAMVLLACKEDDFLAKPFDRFGQQPPNFGMLGGAAVILQPRA